MLDFARGLGILVGMYLLGLGLNRVGIPIPGGVLGLLLFFAGLSAGLIKQQWVEQAANLLLRHMVLLFVPLTVGLMEMRGVIAQHGLAIVASLAVSWLAVLLTTGLLGRWLLPVENESALTPDSQAGSSTEAE